MSNGIYLALSGAVAQSSALEAIADNVANVSTTGHRAERVSFEQVLADRGGPQVRVHRGHRATEQGPRQETSRPLDLSLDGPGAFAVDQGGHVVLVRSASFQVTADGELADPTGRRLLDQSGGPVRVSGGAQKIEIARDGQVMVDGEKAGALLISSSEETFRPATGSEGVVSGVLESSNVEVVRGMIELIQVTRSFEALTRAIESYKTIDERTAREIGNPR